MIEESDYYRILQVRRDAPTELIDARYRSLIEAVRARPHGTMAYRAALLDEAYRTLADPEKRARYDRQLRAEPARPAAAGAEEACLFCGEAIAPRKVIMPDTLCARCESPLAQAVTQRFEHSMRRVVRRIERRQPIRIWTEWGAEAIPGTMQNLSLNGMHFISGRRFEPNQLIKIDCEMCQALARVSHCRNEKDARFATGIEFVTILFSCHSG